MEIAKLDDVQPWRVCHGTGPAIYPFSVIICRVCTGRRSETELHRATKTPPFRLLVPRLRRYVETSDTSYLIDLSYITRFALPHRDPLSLQVLLFGRAGSVDEILDIVP